MARIAAAALALVLCLTQPTLAASTTLIDSTGSLTRTTIPQSSIGNGIVAVISSPDTQSYFPQSDADAVTLSSLNGASIISSPGATLSGTSSLSKGNGAAASAATAGSIVLSGITESDLEHGLDDTRHGQTLNGIFKQKIVDGSASADSKIALIVVVPDSDSIVEEEVLEEVEGIFITASVEVGGENDMSDLYDVSVVKVASEADASKVMQMATDAASKVTVSPNISTTIADVYTQGVSTSAASPTATAAILACDDSFARYQRATRAKLASWKSRTGRSLTVDNFGTAAAQLLKRTMDGFDRDTISAAGIAGSVASYRLEVRSKLKGRIESSIRELFKLQVEILEKSTLKKFNSLLLRKFKDNDGTEQFYNDNAAAVRSAAFAFDSAMNDLEIPSLSLTKNKANQEISTKLNSALLSFPDSPAARLKQMNQVSRAVNKQKQPTERKVDLGLDLVAMIRPDGFGNLQGFGGYQLGGNNIIVGLHNDADEPGVISQFGGKRPPFLRVQPKLKVDVEL